MNGLEILQRHPTGRAYAHLLEGVKKFPVFIDSAHKILSLPPIINSHETGRINEKTKDVFIECSGSSLPILHKILAIITTSLAESGGTIYAMEVSYGKQHLITPDLTPEKIKITPEEVSSLLGWQCKEKDLEKLLPRMGYDYVAGKVSIPAWRTDILHKVDIIEDIAIAYGYDKIIPQIPPIATIGAESKASKIKSKLSEMLIGLGFIELSSYHLIKPEEAQQMKIFEPLELENAKTEYKIVRPNLLIPALRILAQNKDNEYPQNVFEIGTVFERDKKQKTETGILEHEHLLIALAPGNFTQLKQVLDYLSRITGWNYELEETTKTGLIEGRTGTISIQGTKVGYLGEVHPETLRTWNIKMPLAVLEIDISNFLR